MAAGTASFLPVYISPEVKRRLLLVPVAVLVLAPGWSGRLVPIEHDEVLRECRRHDAGEVFGASRDGDVAGEEWHAQYVASPAARFLDALNLRGFATRVVPPMFAAHIPPGMDLLPERADAYFRVETSWRWPWWWPGGGVDWRMPGR